ncbi:MAG: hypothetical protein C0616_02375 [Desulfuromonas sp.]|nr:MAG: hypothetical protein C0616_02375 [Desulfuromonas sp.]
MLEKTYTWLQSHCPPLQRLHAWLDTTLGRFLAIIVKKKISELAILVHKMNDKVLLYVFSLFLSVIFLNITFCLSSFFWGIYKSTHVGSLFVSGQSSTYLFLEYFFSRNDYITISFHYLYSSIVLISFFSITRFLGINRRFYEHVSLFISIPLWTLLCAKIVSNIYNDNFYSFNSVFDFNHWTFIIIVFLLISPTMNFINGIIPEIDDLFINPLKRWRKLKVEYEIHTIEKKTKRE